MNPDKEYYHEFIRSGVASTRMAEFSVLYRSKGITPTINELGVAILLRELGHADDLNGYIERASGNAKAAFKLSRQIRRSEHATLPLKTVTSVAKDSWENIMLEATAISLLRSACW